jgi:outer membrane biosynthesis protein TonB
VERSTGHRATRGRVLESLGRSPRRRLHAVVAAVIASMFGASAFAWYARAPHSPPTPPPAVAQVAPAADTRDVGEPVQYTVRHEPPAPEAIEASEPEPAVLPEPAPAHEAPAAPKSSPRAAAPVTAPAPVATPARDATLDLYATAHHLHFQQHDMAAALAAWDRYLAAAPDGALAPEARFNRVVALVKLARWSEAARALDALDPSFRPADLARLRDVIRQHSS